MIGLGLAGLLVVYVLMKSTATASTVAGGAPIVGQNMLQLYLPAAPPLAASFPVAAHVATTASAAPTNQPFLNAPLQSFTGGVTLAGFYP